jgi:cation:H+ antiporter
VVPLAELLTGVLCAAGGGELFLRGVVGLSDWLRVPKAVTAATLAAFATSSPEISVAVTSALAGSPRVALGDALGSNVVNVGLVLGVMLCIRPTPFDWSATRREFGLALVAPLLVLAALADGHLARVEAAVGLAVFGTWLLLVLQDALKARHGTAPSVTRRQGLVAAGQGAAGLVLLVVAGRLIVAGATGIGAMLGMDLFLIGATVVAFGTSAPELATAVVAKVRGHDDVGVGTVLGSNIFNCLFVVGLAAGIRPFDQPPWGVLSSVAFGVLTVACLAPGRRAALPRSRGVLLLALYAGSVAVACLSH